MSNQTTPNFNALVIALAIAQKEAAQRNAIAQAMRDQFYELFVRPYEDEIAATNQRLAQMEADLKAAARQHALETGDFKLHSSITVKRKPVQFVYDEAEVLEQAEAQGAMELIRVKKELNKVALNASLKAGEYPWVQAEPVHDVTVSIAPLGDILIMLEAGMVAESVEV